MSEKTEKIKKAVQLASKNGFTIPDGLAKEIDGLENPQYRVAIVGQFQVGKSTLINHVFLENKPILHEGDGICTTAVTTEIEYGSSSRLEIYEWNEDKTGDTLSRAIDNPTKEELKSVTIGKDQEERKTLAERYSRIKLFVPNESLKKYTILDTPGVDDPDKDILLNTTYRVIPSADLAIIVIEPRMMNEIEMKLMRETLIKDGVSRFMVLISYRPGSGMSAGHRKEIADTVKAQLANIGKNDIPVEMYCFNESIDDILCSSGEISLRLTSFLSENALAGREIHVAAHVKQFLSDCMIEIAARQTSAGKTEAEKAEFRRKIEEKKQDLKKQCEELSVVISQDIQSIKDSSRNLIKAKITPVFCDFKKRIESSHDLTEAQNLLKNADEELKISLSPAIEACATQIELEIRKKISQRSDMFSGVNMTWNTFLEDELGVDGGFLAKIPSIIFEIANIFIIDIWMPGGVILATLARVMQAVLPLLKEVTIQNFVKTILVKKAEAALNDAQEKTVDQIYNQVCNNLDTTLNTAKVLIQKRYLEQIDLITRNIGPQIGSSETKLASMKAEIEYAIADL